MPSLVSIYKSLHADPHLSAAARVEDKDKIQDGILQRANGPMLAVLSRVRIDPNEVDERTAEMTHVIIYIASSAAIHLPHHVKYDFFLMHHVNSALFYLAINKEPWTKQSDKARMLEWKIRMDLLQYVARGCPGISLDAIATYVPKTGDSSNTTVRDIGKRLHDFGDDGHAIKGSSTWLSMPSKVQEYYTCEVPGFKKCGRTFRFSPLQDEVQLSYVLSRLGVVVWKKL
ncbi:Hypothetical protein NCS54_01460500 [Fusarium falciforme]|uniref:Hypothetical protein n=1 Tax=Fusarium falciforme TaxID=195108 RepID=UPI0022FFF3FF|nr:Hypothetical protein NCS54_01460500 [Fusarium falciforme]WAO96911.1 Hypothetical protein NCS54_01460500 [Fusarium falciforme]